MEDDISWEVTPSSENLLTFQRRLLSASSLKDKYQRDHEHGSHTRKWDLTSTSKFTSGKL
jgi:hypothetical protein